MRFFGGERAGEGVPKGGHHEGEERPLVVRLGKVVGGEVETDCEGEGVEVEFSRGEQRDGGAEDGAAEGDVAL